MEIDEAALLILYDSANNEEKQKIRDFIRLAGECDSISQLEEVAKQLSLKACQPYQKPPRAPIGLV